MPRAKLTDLHHGQMACLSFSISLLPSLPPTLPFFLIFSMNGRGSISICDTVEGTVMRNSDCIQMRNFESRNALRLKTAFHSIRWIARIINVVTVSHDIQSAETIKPRPCNVVQGYWVHSHQNTRGRYTQQNRYYNNPFIALTCHIHLSVSS